ncbi:MAG: hypothetical protein ACRC5A_10935 [Enterobacteriaceae bacterium]
MAELNQAPPLYSFVDNPIIIGVSTNEPINITVISPGVSKNIKAYPGGGFVKVDIRELIKASINLPVYINSKSIIAEINDYVEYQYAILELGNRLETRIAFYGGVSTKTRRHLHEYNLDIFSYRLNNHTRQFLFTTRTNGRHITIGEKEITDLKFIHPGKSVAFVSDRGRMVITPAMPAGTICSFSIAELRKQIYTLYKEISSFFSVLVDHSYIFDISITKSTVDTDCLVFLNSLGCYEKIECVVKDGDSESDTDDSFSNILNQDINEYISEQERVVNVRKLNIQITTHKDNQSYAFEALSSNKIMLETKKGLDKILVESVSSTIESDIIYLNLTALYDTKDTLAQMDIDLSAPDAEFGEWILQDNKLNEYGFLYHDRTL